MSRSNYLQGTGAECGIPPFVFRELGQAVSRNADIVEITGSNPVVPTKYLGVEESGLSRRTWNADDRATYHY